ncbi:hypothetical protein ISF_00740 [Cordyceps fumosorosea ARSEF 2679]|uniref:Uncharacterized protein n=1 Tax=Cordyceps fumosorosea (strain ARSEF 2679) TaxID=1081104 RepID=A0A162N150_CORFA|nr:hypothetical protein ISF_00740 [Cordyceps fumosorosea ARSEF 2679]OAA73839.1 hypothetical protein ISF_00740 [Cordyceps fumosorosea ARSEF 2679]
MESYRVSRASRAVSRIPSSPPASTEDELFYQVFDWTSYSQDTQDIGNNFHSSSSPSVAVSNWQLQESYYSNQWSKDPSGADPYPVGAFSLADLEYDLNMVNASPRSSDDEEPPSPPSDYNGSHSPPELVSAGSASPSEHSGSSSSVVDLVHDADYARIAINEALNEARLRDDEWTYPQGEPSPKQLLVGHPSHAQLHYAKSPEAAGLKRRRSSNEVEKRHRQLQDPMQTADVRKSGACVPCRVSKIRLTRLVPLLDIWSQDAAEEEKLCNGPRFHIGTPRKILLYLNKDSSSTPLKVTVQAYRQQEYANETAGVRLADFPRDEVPSHGQLQRWVEEEIKREHTTKFKYALQSFMLAYHQDGEGLPRHRLVSNVHKLNCFFRIWKTDAFWCHDPTNKFVSLPLSVQARLRSIARQGARSIEHDILKELDDILAQQGATKPDERLAIWASLWQLILIYRETLATFQKHMSRLAKVADESCPIAAEHGKLCHWMSNMVFPLMTTFYHYQFRTKKSLEVSLDWLSSSKYPSKAYKSKALQMTAKHLFESRKDFYSRVQGSSHEVDKLLAALVVNHELKKLNARRRNTKSSKSKGSQHDDCDDDDE